MEYRKRDGETVKANDGQDRLLAVLYGTVPGRMLIKVLVHPVISKIGGVCLNSPASKWMIGPFVRQNQIDLEEYETQTFGSYNDFFIRKIKPENRLVDDNPDHLVSPCDAKLTAYPITKPGVFCIKHTLYTMESLLKNRRLAEKYEGGVALVFRLTVDDYHRYLYVDDGIKSRNIRIPGVLHTVNPVANDAFPIYKENARQYSLLKSKHFGTILMMEVGALMVGKITNHHGHAAVKRGMEKGYFEFGGSTVILCLQPGTVQIDADIWENSRACVETMVKAGEKIGELPKTTGKDS